MWRLRMFECDGGKIRRRQGKIARENCFIWIRKVDQRLNKLRIRVCIDSLSVCPTRPRCSYVRNVWPTYSYSCSEPLRSLLLSFSMKCQMCFIRRNVWWLSLVVMDMSSIFFFSCVCLLVRFVLSDLKNRLYFSTTNIHSNIYSFTTTAPATFVRSAANQLNDLGKSQNAILYRSFYGWTGQCVVLPTNNIQFYDKLFLFLCFVVWLISNNHHLSAAICYIFDFQHCGFPNAAGGGRTFLCYPPAFFSSPISFCSQLFSIWWVCLLYFLCSVLFRLVFEFKIFIVSRSIIWCCCPLPLLLMLFIFFIHFSLRFFLCVLLLLLMHLSVCMCILLAFALIVLCSFTSIYSGIARAF